MALTRYSKNHWHTLWAGKKNGEEAMEAYPLFVKRGAFMIAPGELLEENMLELVEREMRARAHELREYDQWEEAMMELMCGFPWFLDDINMLKRVPFSWEKLKEDHPDHWLHDVRLMGVVFDVVPDFNVELVNENMARRGKLTPRELLARWVEASA